MTASSTQKPGHWCHSVIQCKTIRCKNIRQAVTTRLCRAAETTSAATQQHVRPPGSQQPHAAHCSLVHCLRAGEVIMTQTLRKQCSTGTQQSSTNSDETQQAYECRTCMTSSKFCQSVPCMCSTQTLHLDMHEPPACVVLGLTECWWRRRLLLLLLGCCIARVAARARCCVRLAAARAPGAPWTRAGILDCRAAARGMAGQAGWCKGSECCARNTTVQQAVPL